MACRPGPRGKELAHGPHHAASRLTCVRASGQACGRGQGGTHNLKVWLRSSSSPSRRRAHHRHLSLVELSAGARGELAQRRAEARRRQRACVAVPARIVAKDGLHRLGTVVAWNCPCHGSHINSKSARSRPRHGPVRVMQRGCRASRASLHRCRESPRLCGVACLVVVLQWATADLPARGASCWERACVAGRVGRAGEPRPSVACRAPDSRGPQPCDGRGPTPSVLRLRGGAKSIATKPRTWKQQSKHHAEKRRSSIRKKRGKNAQEATYTKEARANLRKVEDARRLRELSENEERKRRLKEERGTDFNHELRLEYLRATEEADRRRAEKYQTLEDYSDSVEREIEELRQKRGDKRGLTVPDWRGEHPSYWKEVDQEVADQLEDLSNPDKVCAYAPPLPLTTLPVSRQMRGSWAWRSPARLCRPRRPCVCMRTRKRSAAPCKTGGRRGPLRHFLML